MEEVDAIVPKVFCPGGGRVSANDQTLYLVFAALSLHPRGVNEIIGEDFLVYRGGVQPGQAFCFQAAGIDTEPYLAFVRGLPVFVELDDFLLVHAEFDFSLADPFGEEGVESMLWSRGKPYPGKKPVLCGHTPLPLDRILEGLRTNRINLDNGCCYVGHFGYQNLLAYSLDDGELLVQPNIEEDE